MNIAELFVKLGLAGEHAVVKGLNVVKEGFESVSSSSFQTKAAVLGAFYGLERLTAAASTRGIGLYRFSEAFGMSTKRLQELQYMFRQFGAEDEVQPMIEGVAKSLEKMRLGGGVPKIFTMLDIETQGKDAIDVVEQVMKKVRESKIRPSLMLELTSEIGVGSAAFTAMRNIDPSKHMPKAGDILSDEQIKKLAKINMLWSNLWGTLRKMGEVSVAKYGEGLVSSLARAVTLINDLVTGFNKLMEASDGFKYAMIVLGTAILGAFAPVTTVVAALTYALSEIQKHREGKEGIVDTLMTGGKSNDDGIMGAWGRLGEMVEDMFDFSSTDKALPQYKTALASKDVLTTIGGTAGNQSTTNSNSVTNIYVDGKDVTNRIDNYAKRNFTDAVYNSAGRANR